MVQTTAAKASSCVVAAQTMEPDAQAQTVISGDGASLCADDVQVDLPLPQRARRYRRTKKPRKQVKRWWRTHTDAFEQVWPEAAQQLRMSQHGTGNIVDVDHAHIGCTTQMALTAMNVVVFFG